jgi:hypothetical protein
VNPRKNMGFVFMCVRFSPGNNPSRHFNPMASLTNDAAFIMFMFIFFFSWKELIDVFMITEEILMK